MKQHVHLRSEAGWSTLFPEMRWTFSILVRILSKVFLIPAKIKNLSDLYYLTYEDIIGLKFEIIDEETGDVKTRSIQDKNCPKHLIASIQASKGMKFENVLFEIGNPVCWKNGSRKTLQSFQNPLMP